MLYTLEQYMETEKQWIPIMSNHDISKVVARFEERVKDGKTVRIVSPHEVKPKRPSQISFDFTHIKNIIAQADRTITERLIAMLRGKTAATDLGEFTIKAVSFYNNRVNLSDGDTHWNGTLEELIHNVTLFR